MSSTPKSKTSLRQGYGCQSPKFCFLNHKLLIFNSSIKPQRTTEVFFRVPQREDTKPTLWISVFTLCYSVVKYFYK